MKLEEFIKQNRDKLDRYDLKPDHQERFLKKIQAHNAKPEASFIRRHYQKMLLAASVLLLISIGGQYYKYARQQPNDNTELRQSEQYFSQIIKDEITQIQAEETPETRKVFNDAMKQINQLESDYQQLVKDYQINRDKYILNAMIKNFQQRIDILQFVKQEINRIKEHKTRKNETHRA